MIEKITSPRAVFSTNGENDEANANNFSCAHDGAKMHANMILTRPNIQPTIGKRTSGAIPGLPLRSSAKDTMP
jgi:hypothetical protein